MVTIGKVESLGGKAQERAIKMSVQGLSHTAIADELNKDFTAELKSEDVNNFLKRKRNKTFQIVKEDKKFQEKLAKTYFSTIDQMKILNDEMWKFFFEIRKDPEFAKKKVCCPACGHNFQVQVKEFGTLLKTADHLLKQLAHVDTVLGKMSQKSLTVNYNYVDLSRKLTQVMPQLLERAEKMGYVKVRKKRLASINEDL